MITTKEDILYLIKKDEWMIEILRTVKKLNLPDWWICAGFIRTKIWDALHEYRARTLLPDIDVIYFDRHNIEKVMEKEFESKLIELKPYVPWSVKNQARMHQVNQVQPYSSSVDAISKFPETATSIGVKINEQDELILTAPHGIQDLLNCNIKPTPFFMETAERMEVFNERINVKNWGSIWSNVEIVVE